MRPLKPEELDLFAGGAGSTITVTGTRPHTTTTSLYSPEGVGGGGGGGTGGTGGTTSGYVTPGVSAAANAFANAHVHNNGTTANDQQEYQKAHDDLAKLYDWAQQNPNTSVYIGNGEYITGSQLSADLANITINITDGYAGSTGAQTDFNGSTATISINPNNSTVETYNDPSNFNGTGADYVVFHELGHATYDESYGGLSGTTAESQADAAAKSFENDLGIATFTG